MNDIDIIKNYWSSRAEVFSEINREELNTDRLEIWEDLLKDYLNGASLNVLDAGCGAGFFSVLFSRYGHKVTAIDLSEDMLAQAKQNVNAFGNPNNAAFFPMDAQKLEFPDSSFDLVISRNITWVLEHPEEAYKEWMRVLKSGGSLINFDANYFLYMNDPEEYKNYEAGLQAVKDNGLELIDWGHGETFDELISRLPSSHRKRPAWDVDTLIKLGCGSLYIKPKISGKIHDRYNELYYIEIPTFMICAEKTE
ncbi:MAG: class I SAM-dependent methyltransferase [Clostridiales bacterium]|jgi:ubiquinone/menaquinone biosynthesis C-methylase UbiE|nr:class I SAM-dependent methyltransferase [Clostridiales bacterium]